MTNCLYLLIQDAWLDNVEVDGRFAEKHQEKVTAEEDYRDLSSEDIGKIKRNIANLLQPGETVIFDGSTI